MTTTVAPPAAPEVGPYKFLDFYTEIDQHTFAGRERDIREVVARICTNRTFVLYAPSGLGKTSLLLAGVFPILRERRFRPVYVRTIEDPLHDLCTAVAHELQTLPIGSLEALTRVLEEESARATTVIVLDQFEEFFIHFRQQPQQRAAFVESIAALASNEALNVRIVFSLREDYLAELDEFGETVPGLFANDYRLRRLSAFGARQAIAQPLVAAGIPYERRLLVRMVDLLADVAFDPLMLQILCSEVYRLAVTRDPDAFRARLTEEDLEHAGGLDGVVRRYLDRVIASIPRDGVLLSRTILDSLITQETTKRAVTFDAFTTGNFAASSEEVRRVLDVFVRQRLVRTEQRGAQLWYELAHERLVAPVLEWLKLDEDFFNFRVARDLVANTCSGEVWRSQFETLLAEGALVHVVGRYQSRLRLTPLETEFVYRSAVYRQTDTPPWAARLGTEACTRTLLHFLQSGNDLARMGAARAAAQVPDAPPALAEACLDTALTDASVRVRRAAGRTLASIATDAQFRRLETALRDRATRSAALELVADFREAGRPLRRFGWVPRIRARIIATRRVRRAHAEEIRDQGRQGAVVGLTAGALWTLTVGVLNVALLSMAEGSPLGVETILILGWILMAALACGSLLGWRLGRVAALDRALHGRTGWFRSVRRLRFLYWPLVVYGVPMSLIGILGGDMLEGLGALAVMVVAMLVVATLYQLVVGGLASVARPAVWPGVTPFLVWTWALAGAGGLPILAPLFLWWTSEALDLDMGLLFGVCGALVSLSAAVAIATLSRSPVEGVPVVPPRARARARVALAVFALAVPVSLATVHGLDNVPWLARTVVVNVAGATTVEGRLSTLVPDAYHMRLSVPEGGPVWLSVGELPLGVEARIGDLQLLHTALLYLPPGSHRLSVRGRGGNEPQPIRLEPLPVISSGLVVDAGDGTNALVEFRPAGDGSHWSARLSGRIAGASPPGRLVIRMIDAPQFDSEPVDALISMPGADPTIGIYLRGADPFVMTLSASEASVSVPVSQPDGAWTVELRLELVGTRPSEAVGGDRPDTYVVPVHLTFVAGLD